MRRLGRRRRLPASWMIQFRSMSTCFASATDAQLVVCGWHSIVPARRGLTWVFVPRYSSSFERSGLKSSSSAPLWVCAHQ
jgi:hypothetical protein